MFAFYIIISLILLIVLSPFILTFIVFYLGITGFTHLGFSSADAFLVILSVVIGSFINIPLSKKRMVRIREATFFGIINRYVWRAQGVSINLGGCLIPLFIAVYFLSYIPLYPALVSIAVVSFVAFLGSKFVPGVGITASVMLPVVFATLFALILSPDYAAETAFVSGALGVLMGADILRLPSVMKKTGGVLSIGGAGVFDGIFIVAIASAALTLI